MVKLWQKVVTSNRYGESTWRNCWMRKIHGKGHNLWKVEGPCKLIWKDKILKVLKVMNKDKAAGPTGVVWSNYGIWKCWCGMAELCNLIVAEGRILMTGTAVFCYQSLNGKVIQSIWLVLPVCVILTYSHNMTKLQTVEGDCFWSWPFSLFLHCM